MLCLVPAPWLANTGAGNCVATSIAAAYNSALALAAFLIAAACAAVALLKATNARDVPGHGELDLASDRRPASVDDSPGTGWEAADPLSACY